MQFSRAPDTWRCELCPGRQSSATAFLVWPFCLRKARALRVCALERSVGNLPARGQREHFLRCGFKSEPGRSREFSQFWRECKTRFSATRPVERVSWPRASNSTADFRAASIGFAGVAYNAARRFVAWTDGLRVIMR